MTAATNYLENALIDAVLRNTSFSSPASVYAALHTSAEDPGEVGANNEVSGNAYGRMAVTFSAPTDGATSNSANVTFPTASGGNWGTIRWVTIWDAALYRKAIASVTDNAGQAVFNSVAHGLVNGDKVTLANTGVYAEGYYTVANKTDDTFELGIAYSATDTGDIYKGHPLFKGQLNSDVVVNDGNTFVFLTGDLDVTLA